MERVFKGQIYLAHLKGIGSEQQGKRPVVILQNNTGNKYSPTTIIAPLTTADKRHMLKGYTKSIGAVMELKYALENSKTIMLEEEL